MATFSSSSPSSMKEKIEFIRAAVPSAKKTDIVTVLQTCDYSVEQAISALTKDGGRQELEQWTFQRRKSKLRQAPTKSKKTALARQKTPEATEATVGNEASHAVVQEGGERSESAVEEKAVAAANGYTHDTDLTRRHSRQDSVSSTGSCGSSSTTGGLKEGGKKLLKELNKTTVQLPRYQTLQHENFQVAERRIKQEFARLQQCVTDRERELLEMLSVVQSQGEKLLCGRHQSAEKLLLQAESMGSLSEGRASELRGEIKHFVSERRIDDELAKMEWFSGTAYGLEKEIKQFGKVSEIRHLYSGHKAVPSNPSKAPEHTPSDNTHSKTVEQRDVEAKAESVGHSESIGKQVDVEVHNGVDALRLQAELHAKLKEVVSQQSAMSHKQGPRLTNGFVKGQPSHSHQSSTKQEVKRQAKPPSNPSSQDRPSASHQHTKPSTKSSKKRQTDDKRQMDEKRRDDPKEQALQTNEKTKARRDEKRQTNMKDTDDRRGNEEKRLSNSDSKQHNDDPLPLPQRQRRQPRGGRQPQTSSPSLQGVASHTEATLIVL